MFSHHAHSGFDPEDAKSFESFMRFIETECFKLTSELENSLNVISNYDVQLSQLTVRQHRLANDVRQHFNSLRETLLTQETLALEEVDGTVKEIQAVINEHQKEARNQAALTKIALKEVESINDCLKISNHQERLKHVVKLHKLLTTRVPSYQETEDFLNRLPTKPRTYKLPMHRERRWHIKPNKAMILDTESDLNSESTRPCHRVKRARVEEH
jgi:archaellum component FlaC